MCQSIFKKLVKLHGTFLCGYCQINYQFHEEKKLKKTYVKGAPYGDHRSPTYKSINNVLVGKV